MHEEGFLGWAWIALLVVGVSMPKIALSSSMAGISDNGDANFSISSRTPQQWQQLKFDPRLESEDFEYVDVHIKNVHDKEPVHLENLENYPRNLHITLGVHGVDHTIDAEANNEMFKSTYKDKIRPKSDGNRKPPECFYRGFIKGRYASNTSVAHLSICNGGVTGILVNIAPLPSLTIINGTFDKIPPSANSSHYELHYLKHEAKHILYNFEHFRPKKPMRCGFTGKNNKHHDHDHHHSHAHFQSDEEEEEEEEEEEHRNNDQYASIKGKDDDHINPKYDMVSGAPRHQNNTSTTTKPGLLSANECENSPNKYVDVLIINDYTRYGLRGIDTEAHSALVFSYVYFYYFGGTTNGGTSFPGIYSNSEFKCKIKLRLVGQMTWSHGTPYPVSYYQGPFCGYFCGRTDSCATQEYSSSCLISTYAQYLDFYKPQLQNIFGSIDNAPMLSGVDFDGGTIGLAYVGTMCNGGLSVSINQLTGSSAAFDASILAHEIGHNFGMGHDRVGGNVMAPYASYSIATSFSSESKMYIRNFFNNVYGGTDSRGTPIPKCLENDSGLDGYNRTLCGNTRLDPGEQCDPGFDALYFDKCCQWNCRLAPGCVCSDFDECCAGDGQCDIPETCTGHSGFCPPDYHHVPGTECVANISSAGGGLMGKEPGVCYQGACIGKSSSCESNVDRFQFDNGLSEEAICTSVQCFSSSLHPAAMTGTKCGDGKLCKAASDSNGSGGLCVDKYELFTFKYEIIDCKPVCTMENGTIVPSRHCPEAPPSTALLSCTPSSSTTTLSPTTNSPGPPATPSSTPLTSSPRNKYYHYQ
eukprot:jgi/Bigna1/67917/fgenesh1_pg.4_\